MQQLVLHTSEGITTKSKQIRVHNTIKGKKGSKKMKNKNGLNKFKTIAVAPMNTAVAAAHHCTHLVLQPFVTRGNKVSKEITVRCDV